MMYWYDNGSYWNWVPMLVIMLLVLAAFVTVGIVLLRRFPASKRDESAHDALWVLRQRFARGEIDEQEYTSKRDQLLR
jgi:putative membrane protein